MGKAAMVMDFLAMPEAAEVIYRAGFGAATGWA